MYNYYGDIVWKVDIALSILAIALSFSIIIFTLTSDFAGNRRKSALLSIKRGIFELILSGQAAEKNVCLPLASDSTPQLFFDIQSNRDRAVFFNEAEQKFFRKCFISKEKIAALEKTAETSIRKWRRIEAIMCLGYSGEPSALKIFPKLLASRDEDILYFSILALGQIRTAESAKILLSFLKRNILYQYKIISLLENFPREISAEVIKLTEEKDPSVRLWALRLCSRFRDNAYLGRIEKLALDDDSVEVRAAACECLGSMASIDAKAVLQKCLGDREWLVRSSAIMGLSEILGDDCIPLVIDKINDGSLTVIDTVKKVIAKHAEAAIPYILKIFETKDELAKTVCLEALENSGNELARRKASELKGGATGR